MKFITLKLSRKPKRFHNSVSPVLNSTLLAFLGVIISVTISFAAQVTLEWDANSEPNISGYRVYYGKATGDYDVTLDVGNWTTATVADLEDDETYYFAVTAYNTDGLESGYSSEACTNCESPSITMSSGDGGSGGGCFIDTTAYGFLGVKSSKGRTVAVINHFNRKDTVLTVFAKNSKDKDVLLCKKCIARPLSRCAEEVSKTGILMTAGIQFKGF